MIYVQISAGRGPEECGLAVHHVGAMMHAFGPGAKVIKRSDGTYAHSSILCFEGPDAEEFVRSWEGTILWVCKNPLNRPGRERKNWYVGVRRIQVPELTALQIRDEDISIETMRSSGKGGQNVNKRETKVRITHKPTGITVVSEQQRSQKQNLEHAKKLKETTQDQLAEIGASNWEQHNTLERGNPVRTFYGPKFTTSP